MRQPSGKAGPVAAAVAEHPEAILRSTMLSLDRQQEASQASSRWAGPAVTYREHIQEMTLGLLRDLQGLRGVGVGLAVVKEKNIMGSDGT